MSNRLSLPSMLEILRQTCIKDGYDFRVIDDYSKQLVRVASGGMFFLTGTGRINAYPLNDAPAASVARDKVFTYQVLAKAGIGVPDYEYYFLHDAYRAVRGDGREREDIAAGAARIGYPLFVKPLDGSRGNLAEIVHTPDELSLQIERIAPVHHGLILQRVLTGPEYRLFMIDDVALFLYRRKLPFFVGDGNRSVGDFLAEENGHRVAQGLTPITLASPFLQKTLTDHGLTVDAPVAEGVHFPYLAAANISAGGEITDYTETVPAALADWGQRVLTALSLRIGAIDFFARDGIGPPDGLDLIEVNSNPSLAGLIHTGREATVERIWRLVCRKYFSEEHTP